MGRHFWILGSSQRKNKWIHSQERNGQIQVTKSSFGQSLEALRCWCRRSFGLWWICSGHALDSHQVGRLWSTWRFTWTFNPSLQKKVRSQFPFGTLEIWVCDEFENILVRRLFKSHALDSHQVGRLLSTWTFTLTFNPSFQKKVRSQFPYWDFRSCELFWQKGLEWPCPVRSALKRTPVQDFNLFP